MNDSLLKRMICGLKSQLFEICVKNPCMQNPSKLTTCIINLIFYMSKDTITNFYIPESSIRICTMHLTIEINVKSISSEEEE